MPVHLQSEFEASSASATQQPLTGLGISAAALIELLKDFSCRRGGARRICSLPLRSYITDRLVLRTAYLLRIIVHAINQLGLLTRHDYFLLPSSCMHPFFTGLFVLLEILEETKIYHSKVLN